MFLSEDYFHEKKLFDKLKQSKLSLDTIQTIVSDFQKNKERYLNKANELANFLTTFDAVYLTHPRVKSVDSLIEKLLRKAIEGREITPETYKVEITDLIGVRILHIFKSEYSIVHMRIVKEFQHTFVQNVQVNLREGDNENMYKEIHDAQIHKNQDYRSIHYLIAPFDQRDARAEIQVRTVFEDGWSEIDHRLIYKKEKSPNQLLLQHATSILNALSGDCDTLGELMREISVFDSKTNSQIGSGDSVRPESSEESSVSQSLADLMESYIQSRNKSNKDKD